MSEEKQDKVNYEELARKILEKGELSLRLTMAVNFVGYHSEPLTIPVTLRSTRDITLVL